MNRTEFQNWTKHHIRLMDGATGSNLMKAGMPRGLYRAMGAEAPGRNSCLTERIQSRWQ